MSATKKTPSRSGFGPTGSAFPLRADPGADDQFTYIGLSRRDYFAAAALTGIMARPSAQAARFRVGRRDVGREAAIARECHAQADAMWVEACKESPEVKSQTESWKASVQ